MLEAITDFLEGWKLFQHSEWTRVEVRKSVVRLVARTYPKTRLPDSADSRLGKPTGSLISQRSHTRVCTKINAELFVVWQSMQHAVQ